MPSIPNSDEIASSSSTRKTSLYEVLGVAPDSSQAEIREAYRRKSKECHPDTAVIRKEEASIRFRTLQQAYETLRFPDTRKQYDQSLAKTRFTQPLPPTPPAKPPPPKVPGTLELEERPLSSGEIFALFILMLTFLLCLFLALFVGVSRGEVLVQSLPQDSSLMHQLSLVTPPSSRKDRASTSRLPVDTDKQPDTKRPDATDNRLLSGPENVPQNAQ
ncbi:MAG: J domain-containing protein [Cyanobacteria bacterium P01_F01_bin.3]